MSRWRCTKVAKIDAFTIKQVLGRADLGAARNAQKEPGKLEFPNLTVTLAEVNAETWKKWADDSLVKGKASEKSGRIVFLSPNRAETLLEIKLLNVGIYALQPERREANADTIAKLQAGLYVERMELVGPATAAK